MTEDSDENDVMKEAVYSNLIKFNMGPQNQIAVFKNWTDHSCINFYNNYILNVETMHIFPNPVTYSYP